MKHHCEHLTGWFTGPCPTTVPAVPHGISDEQVTLLTTIILVFAFVALVVVIAFATANVAD